ncbi:hypothetical protein RFI_04075 [Reticulomyxa filosa]|uniref:Lysosomal Pro-X carboxypeptidase n=1 Tax=Reticulomyxa filosa TaxID=46433 RepID=X6P4I1_RETFI|nr:hypothetical protein RFI_04075 [Reticulomyxa filosa]|eukprot:ETO33033.1 hypothetical protein RFI_04075 [Reticulomyxa filosa]
MDGCIAASAPVVAFEGTNPLVNPNFFAQGETYDCSSQVKASNIVNARTTNIILFGGASDLCKENFHSSWDIIFNMSTTEEGRKELAQIFRLCRTPNTYFEASYIADWVSNALSYMTMGSYPYASSYMLNGNGYLPPYPMRLGCSYLSQTFDSDNDLLAGVRDAAGVFYNYSQSLKCYDLNVNGNNQTTIDGELWNYLYCTEIFMPFGQDGINDMFWYDPWNSTASAQSCADQYKNGGPRPLWANTNFGGWQIGKGGVTNIVFSNGQLDPWRGGGITLNLSQTITSIVIPDSGHHIDLFFSNPDDTAAVKNAREYELTQIKEWTEQSKMRWL